MTLIWPCHGDLDFHNIFQAVSQKPLGVGCSYLVGTFVRRCISNVMCDIDLTLLQWPWTLKNLLWTVSWKFILLESLIRAYRCVMLWYERAIMFSACIISFEIYTSVKKFYSFITLSLVIAFELPCFDSLSCYFLLHNVYYSECLLTFPLFHPFYISWYSKLFPQTVGYGCLWCCFLCFFLCVTLIWDWSLFVLADKVTPILWWSCFKPWSLRPCGQGMGI